MSLKSVYNILEQIKNVPGRLEKEAIIQKHQNDGLFRKVIVYALNPYLRFNVGSIEYNPDPNQYNEYKNKDSIFNMLNYLAGKRGASNQEKEFLTIISSINTQTANVVNRIVSKDPSCGAKLKIFKKFFPEIPIHVPMLCIKQGDFRHFLRVCNNDLKNTCYSIKKDGVRCWAIHNTENSTTRYLSRSGIEFPNFNLAFDGDMLQAVTTLKQLYPDIFNNLQYIILDGEVHNGTKKGTPGFQKLMTQIRKLKNVDPEIFLFDVFDVVLDDTPLINRYEYLFNLFNKTSFAKTKLLEHFSTPHWAQKFEDLEKIAEPYFESGEEGLVFKYNHSNYEYKRSNFWIKIKKFHTIDVIVEGWEYGTGKNSMVMGKLNCLYNGKKFNVGSGFTDQERIDFMKDTPNMIEVSFQEETKDGIPRFCTYIRPREDK